MKSCQKIRRSGTYAGEQGFSYLEGVSAETMGSEGICMHLLTIPPGGRATAHKHATHETANDAISSETVMFWGERLEHRMEVSAGEILYIPKDMFNLPMNVSGQPAVAVIARIDPHGRESVVLVPEIEHLVP